MQEDTKADGKRQKGLLLIQKGRELREQILSKETVQRATGEELVRERVTKIVCRLSSWMIEATSTNKLIF